MLILSTKHTDEMSTNERRGCYLDKPKSIFEYNKCKAFTNISDERESYNTFFRCGTKWIRKLTTEILIGTNAVSALHLQHTIKKENVNYKVQRSSC